MSPVFGIPSCTLPSLPHPPNILNCGRGRQLSLPAFPGHLTQRAQRVTVHCSVGICNSVLQSCHLPLLTPHPLLSRLTAQASPPPDLTQVGQVLHIPSLVRPQSSIALCSQCWTELKFLPSQQLQPKTKEGGTGRALPEEGSFSASHFLGQQSNVCPKSFITVFKPLFYTHTPLKRKRIR